MSTSREVTVWCDGILADGNVCNDWTYGDKSPRRTVVDARAAARRIGWRCDEAGDFCPDCR